MSDVSQGPGWWLASDGKWYPPESVPPPPPPPPPPTAAAATPATATFVPPRVSPRAGTTGIANAEDNATPTHRKRWLVVGSCVLVVVVAAVIVLTTLGGGTSQLTAHGSMEVDDFTGSCLIDSGFSDIGDGTQVVVTNASSTVVGTAALSYNASLSKALSKIQPGLSTCIYDFTVTVPRGLPRYGITISHRGTVWFSPLQMTKGPGLSVSSGGTGSSGSGTGDSGNTGSSGNTP
jgi:hypothetical protein